MLGREESRARYDSQNQRRQWENHQDIDNTHVDYRDYARHSPDYEKQAYEEMRQKVEERRKFYEE